MERQESERTRRNRFIQSMITFIMKFVCKTRRTSGTIEELKNIKEPEPKKVIKDTRKSLINSQA